MGKIQGGLTEHCFNCVLTACVTPPCNTANGTLEDLGQGVPRHKGACTNEWKPYSRDFGDPVAS